MEVSEQLHQQAISIQKSLLHSLQGCYVSILIDGAKKYWHTYEGVMLYIQKLGLPNDLMFLSLITINKSTANYC